MSLSPRRARAYLFGACTGAFTALAIVAWRRRRRPTAAFFSVVALVCGALSVSNEERAPD